MALRDELGIRMKNFYESVPETKAAAADTGGDPD